TVSFETTAGVIRARIDEELVTLQMSDPCDVRLGLELAVDGEKLSGDYINTGVPHFVARVPDIGKIDVRRTGSAIRRYEIFVPKGTNANYSEKRGRNRIAIRTYERGVENETLACGTGVVASALTFALTENVEGPIGVLVRGGNELSVGFNR